MAMARTLSLAEARAFYDRFGAKQDLQFYENAAVDALLAHARIGEAHRVFELGCGTGRLAARLLEALPADARYLGLDISPVMVRLATARLLPWKDRSEVRVADGTMPSAEAAGTFDRFFSTYVLDLLAEDQIHASLAEAHRLLGKGGLLCLAGLTEGTTLLSRVVCRVWSRLYAVSPGLVGGCRPVRLSSHLPPDRWDIQHHEMVVSWGVPSEVLVATRK
jgi:ubiquinone/menaquinone biosynthesis C-methylase UbiE